MSNAAQYGSASSSSGGKRARVSDLLSAADLPEAVSARIDAIVRTSKLWPREREEIARELIAHAQDALAAGTTPEATAAALGDPATIGQLLRRSVRRKRPLAWQIRYRVYQVIGVALVLMFFSYTILFVRFNTGSPVITTNYLAQLNERRSAHTEDQYAITAYEALRQAWAREVNMLATERTADYSVSGIAFLQHDPRLAHKNIPHSSSEHLHYDLLLETHQRLLPLIDEAVRASHLPVLGVLYTDRFEDIIDEDGVQIITPMPPAEDIASSGMMIEVMLHWPIAVRQSAQLFAFDALLAARNGDADRATASLIAVLNSARLIGQEHHLIVSLIATALQSMAEDVLLRILYEHPGMLDEQHLRDIAHVASASASIAQRIDFETERQTFSDLIQRVYTKNADGDGRLTRQGVDLIDRLTTLFSAHITAGADEVEPSPKAASRFVGPLAMVAYGSRREQEEAYDRLILNAQATLQHHPGSAERARLHERTQSFAQELGNSPRYWMVGQFAPAFERSVNAVQTAQAHADATLVTIALHVHHHRTGQWPDSLDELTPSLLPAVPDDPFDPGQRIKYRVVENAPHIYFVGANGIDNKATRPTSDRNNARSLTHRYFRGEDSPSAAPEDQADWVIFPPHSSSK